MYIELSILYKTVLDALLSVSGRIVPIQMDLSATNRTVHSRGEIRRWQLSQYIYSGLDTINKAPVYGSTIVPPSGTVSYGSYGGLSLIINDKKKRIFSAESTRGRAIQYLPIYISLYKPAILSLSPQNTSPVAPASKVRIHSEQTFLSLSCSLIVSFSSKTLLR